MALFRRILSPRDQPHIPADQDGPEERSAVENNRSRGSQREESADHKQHQRANSIGESKILQSSEPSGVSLLNPPPQLPPRNPGESNAQYQTGLGYRRTQSGGSTIMLRRQVQPEGGDANVDTYFVPADTLRAYNSAVAVTHVEGERERTGTQTLQEVRNQHMHDRIMAHNNPVLRADQRSRSTENLVDISDYSVPFQTEEPRDVTQALSKRGRKQRHSTSAVKTQPHDRRLSHPPNFAPPPPPSAEGGEERLSSVSPISPTAHNTDYSDPWDSNKFQLHKKRQQGSGRQRAESSPHSSAQPVSRTPPPSILEPPCRVTPPPILDERHGSNTPPDHHHSHKAAETEHPRRSEVHHHHPQHHHPHLSQNLQRKSNSESELASINQSRHSPPLPPLPPRNPQPDPAHNISGESDYVEPPDAGFSSAEDDSVHDYVIPPDATSSSSQDSVHEGPPMHDRKGHRYPPLLPGPTFRHNYMYPPDPRMLPPPAYIINTMLPLENQP